MGKNMLEQNTVHRNKANPIEPLHSSRTGMRVFTSYLHTIPLYRGTSNQFTSHRLLQFPH